MFRSFVRNVESFEETTLIMGQDEDDGTIEQAAKLDFEIVDHKLSYSNVSGTDDDKIEDHANLNHIAPEDPTILKYATSSPCLSIHAGDLSGSVLDDLPSSPASVNVHAIISKRNSFNGDELNIGQVNVFQPQDLAKSLLALEHVVVTLHENTTDNCDSDFENDSELDLLAPSLRKLSRQLNSPNVAEETGNKDIINESSIFDLAGLLKSQTSANGSIDHGDINPFLFVPKAMNKSTTGAMESITATSFPRKAKFVCYLIAGILFAMILSCKIFSGFSQPAIPVVNSLVATSPDRVAMNVLVENATESSLLNSLVNNSFQGIDFLAKQQPKNTENTADVGYDYFSAFAADVRTSGMNLASSCFMFNVPSIPKDNSQENFDIISTIKTTEGMDFLAKQQPENTENIAAVGYGYFSAFAADVKTSVMNLASSCFMFNVPSIPKENSQEITDIISTIKTNIKSFSDLEVSPNVSIIPFRLFSSRLATAYRVARITYGWFKWITAAVGGILFICLVIKIVAFFASSRNEQAKRIHRVKSEPDSRVEVLSWSSMIPPKPCVVKSESTECHGGSKRVACMSTQSQTSSSFQATSTGQVRDLTNSEELILFLCTSSDQLSRSGRRSRTARESSPQVNFDTSAYEQLSKPDLLLIGRGLGIRKMPKGMNKAPLIVSVVEAYESVLLNFTEHEILGVLDILGAQNIEAQPRIRRCVLGKLEKIELVKLAVEIAF